MVRTNPALKWHGHHADGAALVRLPARPAAHRRLAGPTWFATARCSRSPRTTRWCSRCWTRARSRPEEVASHPQRLLLLRAPHRQPQLPARPPAASGPPPATATCLCSDGLHVIVPPDAISQVLLTVADPDQAAADLLALALDGGAPGQHHLHSRRHRHLTPRPRLRTPSPPVPPPPYPLTPRTPASVLRHPRTPCPASLRIPDAPPRAEAPANHSRHSHHASTRAVGRRTTAM